MRLIRRFLNYLRRLILLIRAKKKDVVVTEAESNKDIITSSVSRTIFEDNILKSNEMLYLIVLINAYDNALGYAEISNKDIMKAVNCKNPNTVSDIINRLEKKKYIKNIQLKKGKAARYKILKYLELSGPNNSQLLSKTSISHCESMDNDEDVMLDIKPIESSINNGSDSDDTSISLMKMVQEEFRTSREALNEIVDRTIKIDDEIDSFLKENIKE